ncbi:hypothetical protein [Nocardioides mangrovi]|uniref:Uncharacterized protein n=1 Tax=Nocardioides mangrovi TaxID=2874580 RepID=A0ABS7UHK9_9ACTN|nr:hypothetical protein [Nocardioides mangrovi]MBZ5740285.1 hypothetical protein [Nocardioides mangrovi]
MRRAVGVGAAAVGVAAVLVAALVVGLGGSDNSGTTDGPVITLAGDWDGYPAAEVTGRLTLVDGCLLLGRSVVFWPHGASWDADEQAVEFGGDFDDSTAVTVGAMFTGGGGFFSAGTLSRLTSIDADALLRCVRTTGADDTVMAYPSG